jgi:hypothetical protein
VAKCGTGWRQNHCLISAAPWINVRAMSKYLVILISLIWASLLLVSWSGSAESRPQPAPPAAGRQGF